jgi:hypothetical protein
MGNYVQNANETIRDVRQGGYMEGEELRILNRNIETYEATLSNNKRLNRDIMQALNILRDERSRF